MAAFDEDRTLDGSEPPFRSGSGYPGSGRVPAGRDPEVRAAVRTIRLLAAGLFVALVGTAVFVTSRIVASGRDGGARTLRPPTSATTLAPEGRFTDVGPLPGTEIDAYVSERRRALAAAEGTRTAVVSLRSYRSGEAALEAAGRAEVLALLVAAPGGAPATVSGTLEAWASEQRRRDTDERDELRRLIPTVDDPAFKADYEAEVLRLGKAIEAIDPEGDVVFALVVRAPTATLAELANERNVRLVDVAPSPDAADDAVYRGLRPEETAKASAPPTRAPRPG